MQAVWRDSFVTDDSLVQCMVELRRALEDHAQRYIKTVPRRGYVFVADVTEGGPRNDVQAGLDVEPNSAAEEFYSTDHCVIDSLAVLPLTNAGADPNLDYFSDGITESIISSLSQLPGLRVMAWSTVSRFRGQRALGGVRLGVHGGTSPSLQKVGDDLGVRAVLTGRVLQLADNLVIAVELVNLADGSQLWGGQYKRKLTDIFEVQEEIAKEITEKLRLRLTGPQKRRLIKRHTEDAAAYQAYLKGRFYWNKRSEEGLRKGLEFFKLAVEQDPTYALAYDGLADSYNVLGFYSILPPKEAFPRARSAAKKALEIDDTLAEAHASLAYVNLYYDWDWQVAENGFRRAIELNPNYPMAHQFYDNLLTAMGRLEEALAELKRAQELDPLSLIMNAGLGWVSYFARQYDQAIEYLRKALELDSNFELAHLWLGWVYEQKSMFAEAILEFEKAVALSGGRPDIVAALGHAYALSGKRDEAEMVLDRLAGLSKQRYVSAYCLATIYAGLGDKQQTFTWLEQAYADRSHLLVFMKVDPKLDSLRSSSRFKDLVRRVGLPY
jgi:TolB-like protein/Tfp pilus assembly protein PilF